MKGSYFLPTCYCNEYLIDCHIMIDIFLLFQSWTFKIPMRLCCVLILHLLLVMKETWATRPPFASWTLKWGHLNWHKLTHILCYWPLILDSFFLLAYKYWWKVCSLFFYQILANPKYKFNSSSIYKNIALLAWDPAPYDLDLEKVNLIKLCSWHSALITFS